jgi:hypothetical protein
MRATLGEAEAQPGLVAAPAVGVEAATGHVGDPMLDRLGEQVRGVDALGHGQPDVERARWVGSSDTPSGISASSASSIVVRLLVVDLPEALDLFAPGLGRQPGLDDHLGQVRRAQVGGLAQHDELVADRARGATTQPVRTPGAKIFDIVPT